MFCCVPVNPDQHEQHRDPQTEAAIIHLIIHTCDVPSVTCQNVFTRPRSSTQLTQESWDTKGVQCDCNYHCSAKVTQSHFIAATLTSFLPRSWCYLLKGTNVLHYDSQLTIHSEWSCCNSSNGSATTEMTFTELRRFGVLPQMCDVSFFIHTIYCKKNVFCNKLHKFPFSQA